MKSIHYIVVVIVLLVGLGISFLLIPERHQMALIYFKAKETDVALEAYEQLLSEGDESAAVILPLTRLCLQAGDVSRAVALMERFVANNPKHLEALEQLALYYQYDQRPEEYLFTLEVISQIEPSESNLRKLSHLYNFSAQPTRQREALQKLVARYPNRAQDFIDLAYLRAADGMIPEAAEALVQLQIHHPLAMNAKLKELQVSFLLDSHKPWKAFSEALAWLENDRSPQTAVRFARLLRFKGQPKLGWQILEPFESEADHNTNLLTLLVDLEVATGLEDKAFSRLKALHLSSQLPPQACEPFIDLALARNQTGLAFQAAGRIDLRLLPAWLLMNLATATLSLGEEALARKMTDQLPREFLEEQPVLAALLAVTLQQAEPALEWASKAEKMPQLSQSQRLSLARVYIRLARHRKAIQTLRPLVKSQRLADQTVLELARLYIQAEDAAQGVKFFEKLRRRLPSQLTESGWALTAAAAGQSQAVRRWLKSVGLSIQEEVLVDIYHLALDGNQSKLAVAAAELLHQRRPGIRQRRLLGRALVAAGQASQALPLLRSPVPDSLEHQEAYGEALSAAYRQGAPVQAEFRDYLIQRLAEPDWEEERRVGWIHGLIDLEVYKPILPELRRLAADGEPDWFYAYLEAAEKSGRETELVAFLQKELERPELPDQARNLRLEALIKNGGEDAALPYLPEIACVPGSPWNSIYEQALLSRGRREELAVFWEKLAQHADSSPDQKRELAYRVLDHGQKQLAERLFTDLARRANPRSPDVLQLLFLWGPRPRPSSLDWLETRARGSSGEERADWLNHLTNSGASRRAVAVVRSDPPPPGRGGKETEAYLQALVASQDKTGLAAALRREGGVEAHPGRLRRYARLALEMDDLATAQAMFGKLLSVHPRDPEALKWVGISAFARSQYSQAKKILAQLISLGLADYESHYYLSEILRREGDFAGARRYQERALSQIDSRADQPLAMRLTRAQLLHRLGRRTQSRLEFARLLEQDPGNKHLRADLASLLLEDRETAAAQQVLSGSVLEIETEPLP